MVRISKDTLIIEISTKKQEPLALLADLQRGIINMIAIIPYGIADTPKERLSDGLQNITKLLGEMMISQDQCADLNRDLNQTQITDFNKW